MANNRWLKDPIWDSRLQAIWIVFSGIYLSTGTFHSVRWLSSLAITIAGFLILFLACHTLVAAEPEKSRNTLLVSLAGCLFLIFESWRTYHDSIGSVFAAIFALALTMMIWLRDDHPSRIRISYTFILLMLACLIFSFFQLAITIITKIISVEMAGQTGPILIPAHVIGMLSGMVAFLVLDRRVLRSLFSDSVPRHPWFYENFRMVFFPAIGIGLTWYFNIDTLEQQMLNRQEGLIFSFFYFSVQFLLVFVFIMLRFSQKQAKGHLGFLAGLVLMGAALLSLIDLASSAKEIRADVVLVLRVAFVHGPTVFGLLLAAEVCRFASAKILPEYPHR